MDEAVDQVIEEKYGSAGIFTDPTLISRAYKNPTDAETYLKLENRHPPEAIRYTKDICNYIYETYGRFPAHIDALLHARLLGPGASPRIRLLPAFFRPLFVAQSSRAQSPLA